jgi:hypothetical protein
MASCLASQPGEACCCCCCCCCECSCRRISTAAGAENAVYCTVVYRLTLFLCNILAISPSCCRFGMMCAQMKAFFDATGGLWQKGALVSSSSSRTAAAAAARPKQHGAGCSKSTR